MGLYKKVIHMHCILQRGVSIVALAPSHYLVGVMLQHPTELRAMKYDQLYMFSFRFCFYYSAYCVSQYNSRQDTAINM